MLIVTLIHSHCFIMPSSIDAPDEGKALALLGVLVLGKEDASDCAKAAKQVLEVAVPRLLRQVGDTDSGRVVDSCRAQRCRIRNVGERSMWHLERARALPDVSIASSPTNRSLSSWQQGNSYMV